MRLLESTAAQRVDYQHFSFARFHFNQIEIRKESFLFLVLKPAR